MPIEVALGGARRAVWGRDGPRSPGSPEAQGRLVGDGILEGPGDGGREGIAQGTRVGVVHGAGHLMHVAHASHFRRDGREGVEGVRHGAPRQFGAGRTKEGWGRRGGGVVALAHAGARKAGAVEGLSVGVVESDGGRDERARGSGGDAGGDGGRGAVRGHGRCKPKGGNGGRRGWGRRRIDGTGVGGGEHGGDAGQEGMEGVEGIHGVTLECSMAGIPF